LTKSLRCILCDGRALLESCVEEMAPVAESCGVALHLGAEAAEMRNATGRCCSGPSSFCSMT
jgi:hypothetical protein